MAGGRAPRPKETMKDRSKPKSTILIIDDDEQIRGLLKELLSLEHECVDVGSAEEALSILDVLNFSLVISDIQMPGISGLDLVPRIIERTPETVVVMISGQQSIESAIEAMRVGAFDYITKPLDLRHVQAAVRRALAHHQLLTEKMLHDNHLEELVAQRTAEIEHLAFYDRLTDLPNRTLFADRCAQALASAQRTQRPVGVLLVGLDRFKKIVDTLGHAAGDVVLSEAAARLQGCVSSADTVARFEGEEFALLLTQIAEAADLADVSLAVSDAFKEPFSLGDQVVYVTTSIGISLSPFNGEDSNTVLRNAGAALYRAKKQGGNNHQFYAADMNAQAVERLELENSLRRAIDNDEFVTYYQPVVDLVSTEIVGTEALVRWQHPELGLLPPARFIGLAEDTGLIVDISELVLRTACDQTRRWHDEGLGRLRIAVNISARHLQQKNFLERLRKVLAETRLDPTCLELELTETSIMENAESATELLTEIRELGVKIAIDDFGTGYSSLSYLKRLPIDTVKLDRSFVSGATTDPDDAALVMAIVTLAHNLRLRVVAEGVETAEQLTFLRLLKCDEGQGFLFSKPVSREIFAASLARDPKRKLYVVSDPARKTLSRVRSAVNE
jgi:diguanylate cyclase (GGDEF)-like protein